MNVMASLIRVGTYCVAASKLLCDFILVCCDVAISFSLFRSVRSSLDERFE